MDTGSALGALGVIAIVLLSAGAVVAFILFMVHQAKLQRQRMEALEQLANGLSFGGPGAGWFSDFESHAVAQHFEDFQSGHSRGATWIRHGKVSVHGIRGEMVFGDYHYKVTSGSGKNQTTTTYQFSFLLWVPIMELPESLALRQENFLDRIGEWVGVDDIDFESSEFSRKFHIKCSDKRAAVDLFDPRMMEWMLEETPPGMSVRGGAFFFRGATLWSAAEYVGLVKWIGAFVMRLPRHFVDARCPREDVEVWESNSRK